MNPASQPATPAEESGYNELGHLIRLLHDTLRGLGSDKAMQNIAGELPDTQDRLHYIGQLAEQTAQRVLTAVEVALPMQDTIETRALALSEEWRNAKAKGNGEIHLVGEKMQAFLEGIPVHARATSSQLRDIMMAQEFQDLTGQVIKKISRLTQDLEHQLVHILLISKPADDTGDHGLLNGPVVSKEGRNDIVNDQEEVDDLLKSLGF